MAAQLVSSAYCGKQQSVPVLALHSSACFRLHSTRLHAGASVRYSRQRTLNFASEVPARLIVRATQRESPAESSGRPGAEHSGASVPLTVPSVQNLAQKTAKGAAIAAFALALALSSPYAALAARSGGRVGGSSFSSARSSMGSSSRSYGGSGFGGSSGRSLGSGYSGSGSSGLSSAPSLRSGGSTVNFGWGLVPFGGYGYGYGYPGAYGGGGGGLGNLLLYGILAVFAFTAVQSLLNRNGDDTSDYVGDRVAVAKLQVGLLGSARALQRQLDRIASRADTTSPSGLHYILQETVLQLVRNPEYVQYGAASVSNQRDLDRGEAKFNELSLQERSKFKEETLVNVGGRTRRQAYSRGGGSDGPQEYIVVTILVAATGKLELPKINSQEQLVTALNRLAILREEQVMAVEVLWTPEDESDSYSKDEMLLDYPSLNNV